MEPLLSSRACIAFVAVISAVLAAGPAASLRASPRAAKDFLASARALDKNALHDLRTPCGLRAALTRVRASQSDLRAALDTLGAAELGAVATLAIRGQMMAASRTKHRALRRPSPASQLFSAVTIALGHETKAAELLGDEPKSPTIVELPIPLSPFSAFDLALGHDGHSVWVSGSDASRILLYPSFGIGENPVVYKLRPGSFPHTIVVGPDDALYVAETGTNLGGNAIARLTPDGNHREFPLPAGAGSPWGITVGPDRKIWFTEVGAGKVGRLDPATGDLVEFPLRTRNSQPQGIVTGPDGALWGTESEANQVFRISADGHVTEFRIPTPRSLPVSIAAGRGGVLWVSEFAVGKLFRLSPAGRAREFALPSGAHPYGIASAPDGNIWFADRGRNEIGLITPAGHVFEYALPTENAQPMAVAPLGTGKFAFVELVGNRIGTFSFGRGKLLAPVTLFSSRRRLRAVGG